MHNTHNNEHAHHQSDKAEIPYNVICKRVAPESQPEITGNYRKIRCYDQSEDRNAGNSNQVAPPFVLALACKVKEIMNRRWLDFLRRSALIGHTRHHR